MWLQDCTPKWNNTEATMIEQGITPAVSDWPSRSKQWFYAHGGIFHPATGKIMGPTDKLYTNLIKSITEARQGKFQHDRENAELTRALENPEHLGRT
jgi:hypothetical protein